MKKLLKIFVAFAISFLFTACNDKEPYVKLDPLASNNNKILNFSINGVAGVFGWDDCGGDSGCASDIITVLLPYSAYSGTLIPEFEISAGATVTPKSGVAIDKTSTSWPRYTVTDSEGLSRSYRIDIYRDEPMYSIGDYYPDAKKPSTAEGVIFELDETREHGKIISLDETQGLIWSTEFIEIGNIGSGYDRIEWIKANKNIANYPAFKWCADKGDGWYLPTGTEIWKMTYKAITETLNPAIEQISGAVKMKQGENYPYLTSTEQNYVYASAYWVTYGGSGYKSFPKNTAGDYYIRAVKAF